MRIKVDEATNPMRCPFLARSSPAKCTGRLLMQNESGLSGFSLRLCDSALKIMPENVLAWFITQSHHRRLFPAIISCHVSSL